MFALKKLYSPIMWFYNVMHIRNLKILLDTVLFAQLLQGYSEKDNLKLSTICDLAYALVWYNGTPRV